MVYIEEIGVKPETRSTFDRLAEPLSAITSEDHEFASFIFLVLSRSNDPDHRALAAYISCDVSERDATYPEILEAMGELERDPVPFVSEAAQEMSRIMPNAA